jgi:hypothetical protein
MNRVDRWDSGEFADVAALTGDRNTADRQKRVSDGIVGKTAPVRTGILEGPAIRVGIEAGGRTSLGAGVDPIDSAEDSVITGNNSYIRRRRR